MVSVGLVVLASLGAVALISSRVVRVELNQLTTMAQPVPPRARQELAAAVAAHYERQGLHGMAKHLAELRAERFPRSEVLLVGPDRRVLAASGGVMHNAAVEELPDGTMRIRFDRMSRRSEILVRGGATPVTAGNVRVGSLLLTPRLDRVAHNPMRAVNRWLLLAVALVGAAALAFTALLAARIFAPLERLQAAAARVRGGALSERVPVTSRDEVGQLTEAFNAMTARLERHEEQRRNMVNDVAHELRTPLTNLRATVEAIQDGLRRPDEQVIDSLHEDLLLMQRLVEDLQTLALAEAGKLPLHIEEVNVQEELERFARAQAEPRLHVDAEAGVIVRVDRVRLQQMLSNLVRNSLGHITATGRIEVTATRRDDMLRLSVADDGSGIPARDLPHVFDRFYRADASRSRATGGAGLGLAIVRNLVELQGGRISAESEEGRGARFVIELPLRPSGDARAD